MSCYGYFTKRRSPPLYFYRRWALASSHPLQFSTVVSSGSASLEGRTQQALRRLLGELNLTSFSGRGSGIGAGSRYPQPRQYHTGGLQPDRALWKYEGKARFTAGLAWSRHSLLQGSRAQQWNRAPPWSRIQSRLMHVRDAAGRGGGIPPLIPAYQAQRWSMMSCRRAVAEMQVRDRAPLLDEFQSNECRVMCCITVQRNHCRTYNASIPETKMSHNSTPQRPFTLIIDFQHTSGSLLRHVSLD